MRTYWSELSVIRRFKYNDLGLLYWSGTLSLPFLKILSFTVNTKYSQNIFHKLELLKVLKLLKILCTNQRVDQTSTGKGSRKLSKYCTWLLSEKDISPSLSLKTLDIFPIVFQWKCELYGEIHFEFRPVCFFWRPITIFFYSWQKLESIWSWNIFMMRVRRGEIGNSGARSSVSEYWFSSEPEAQSPCVWAKYQY